MAKNRILDVPSVKDDPIRKAYIGKELEIDDKQKVGPTGGVMHSTGLGCGLYFWPNEIQAA